MDLTSFSSALNASQLEAVTYCEGPSLVIAGAGSGKTRVLTYKIAYLLRCGFEPWSIMALTFTNKAAREMNERIAAICTDMDTRGLWSGTFHSLFARLLRKEHEWIGFPADYTIYDTSDSRSLIKALVKEFGLDEKTYKATTVSARISEAKNHLVLPAQYAKDASIQRRDHVEGLGETHRIYAAYQQRLRAASAMDFDDLLLQTFLLLRDHPELRERYKARFRYILVDEYQDTNPLQYNILNLLTDPDSRICVVGDDAQSIYGFRGADINNILNFKEQYPTARVIKLECNYRSTQCIVEAANSIISNNKGQIPKKVYAAGEEGERIRVFRAKTDKEEAQKVAERVVKLHRKGVEYKDMALLYRTNAQSRSFEEVFQTAGIPYRIYGGLSFYQRKEIKDVLAYFRLITNPDDEEAFRRIINYPARGLGATTVQKIQLAASAAGVSPWQVACNPEQYALAFHSGIRKKLSGFCEMIATFRKNAETQKASDLAADVVHRSGIAADISAERTAESIAREENVDELLGSIVSFEKEVLEEQGRSRVQLTEFLATVSLLTDSDQQDDGQPRVTLMTVHAAKGLEFEAVFVTGMEEDLFPNASARLYPKEMEEERRLFYVAVTRAKRYCSLSYADTRFRYGSLQLAEPSPFLDEIDEQYVEREDKPLSSAPVARADFGQRNAWGGSPNARNFEEFFGAPSEDDFRSNASLANRGGGNGYGDGAGYKRYGRYRNDDAVTTPRRVVPPAPPAGFKRAGTSSKQPSAAHSAPTGEPVAGLSIGARISHDRFGMGTVVGTEGQGDSAKVRVSFDEAGVKNLLVKFAKFRVL